jgi:uncharacterized protein (TIGR03437 family)
MRKYIVAATLLVSTAALLSAQSNLSVVNAASFINRFGTAAGSLATAFGTFPGAATATAPSVPWPGRLGGTQVLVNGVVAPLYFVSPTQINFQVPSATAAGSASVFVAVNGTTVAQGTMDVRAVSPAIFLSNPQTLQGAVLDQNNAVNSVAAPAHRGEVIQIFGTGQGPLQTPVLDGTVPSPYAVSVRTPKVYISDIEAAVQFSGVSSYPGLWQINAVVPDRTFVAGQVPVVLVLDGVQSNQGTIWVAE